MMSRRPWTNAARSGARAAILIAACAADARNIFATGDTASAHATLLLGASLVALSLLLSRQPTGSPN